MFIKRLWRSIRYEDICLHEYRNVAVLETGVEKWLESRNTWRPHKALENHTPMFKYRT